MSNLVCQYSDSLLYSFEEFMDRKRDSNGIPPAKDPKYDTRL